VQVIATSRFVGELACRDRFTVVYPGVAIPPLDHEYHLGQAAPGLIVGAAARLDRLKGIDILIRAVATLRADFPDLTLEVAGAGPDRARLEDLVGRLALGSRVRFLGWQNNLTGVMARWDVFAFPTLSEGFGIAALEAMALGKPVVASAVGGVPELVEHGSTGWLVSPGDPDALATSLRVLLVNAEQRRTMGAAGRARAAETFSEAAMVAAISDIYAAVLRR
jgi:glycosyltransferase involved in cell wall biosynthesis